MVTKSAKSAFFKKEWTIMKRYFAKEVNGKGYLYDRKFASGRVPIATETTYEFACQQAEKFNKEEDEEEV